MGDDLDRVLRALESAREFAASYRFEMTPEYRALIERVEAMPRNHPGAEKSGRWIGSVADHKARYADIRPAPTR